MNETEFQTEALTLVKSRLGISSHVRDGLLQATINAVFEELTNKIKLTSASHLMFVVDLATWRYQSVAEKGLTGGSLPMPRHLQYRLHNLILSASPGATDV